MSKKRKISQSTETPTGKILCPKCGQRYLVRGNHTAAGKRRWVCRESTGDRRTCYTTTDPHAPYRDQSGTAKTPDKNPQFRRKLSGVKRFIITAAQNATPTNMEFFETLEQYAKLNEAELVVIPLRYKNPTSRWNRSAENAEEWLLDVGERDLIRTGYDKATVEEDWVYGRGPSWDELRRREASKYLYNQRKKLNDNLVLVGDVKTQPTAARPLSGFESLTAGESCIIGHTKLQMMTVAVPAGRYPKILTTTGACTQKNYSDTKAGKKGEFHHATTALVVEIIGKKFFVRHVNWDAKDGSFIDLWTKYSPKGAAPAPRPLALVFGDTHRQFIDKQVEKATYGPGGMVETLNPEHLIFHDLHDGYARNPHHRLDPFSEIAKRSADLHVVEREVRGDVSWLQKVCEGRKGIVVPSNHDNFFARWILDTDWRRDPDNASFYLETAKVMVDSTHMSERGAARVDPFTYWVDRLKGDSDIRCLKRDEPFVLGGVELSLHGDIGPNGARGSRLNLRRIGAKTIVGHSHSPGIEEGCYQAGTSTSLRLEYNTGPSSWLNAHVILYANGKRAILPIIDGMWSFDAAQE